MTSARIVHNKENATLKRFNMLKFIKPRLVFRHVSFSALSDERQFILLSCAAQAAMSNLSLGMLMGRIDEYYFPVSWVSFENLCFGNNVIYNGAVKDCMWNVSLLLGGPGLKDEKINLTDTLMHLGRARKEVPSALTFNLSRVWAIAFSFALADVSQAIGYFIWIGLLWKGYVVSVCEF